MPEGADVYIRDYMDAEPVTQNGGCSAVHRCRPMVPQSYFPRGTIAYGR